MFVKEWIAQQKDQVIEPDAVGVDADNEPSTDTKFQKLRFGIVIGVTVLVVSIGVFFLVRSILARRSKKGLGTDMEAERKYPLRWKCLTGGLRGRT